jgi:hypothetical protein
MAQAQNAARVEWRNERAAAQAGRATTVRALFDIPEPGRAGTTEMQRHWCGAYSNAGVRHEDDKKDSLKGFVDRLVLCADTAARLVADPFVLLNLDRTRPHARDLEATVNSAGMTVFACGCTKADHKTAATVKAFVRLGLVAALYASARVLDSGDVMTQQVLDNPARLSAVARVAMRMVRGCAPTGRCLRFDGLHFVHAPGMVARTGGSRDAIAYVDIETLRQYVVFVDNILDMQATVGELLDGAVASLTVPAMVEHVDRNIIVPHFAVENRDGQAYVTTRSFHRRERETALHLATLARNPGACTVQTALLPALEQHIADHPTEETAELVACMRTMCRNAVCVVRGLPGVGKSHSVRLLVRAMVAHTPGSAVVMSFTAAVANMHRDIFRAESTAVPECMTMHRFVAMMRSPKHRERFTATVRLIVVDEFSMVSQELVHDFLCAVLPADPALASTWRPALVFVGDEHQLPPIETGHFGVDVVASALPIATINHSRREVRTAVPAENNFRSTIDYIVSPLADRCAADAAARTVLPPSIVCNAAASQQSIVLRDMPRYESLAGWMAVDLEQQYARLHGGEPFLPHADHAARMRRFLQTDEIIILAGSRRTVAELTTLLLQPRYNPVVLQCGAPTAAAALSPDSTVRPPALPPVPTEWCHCAACTTALLPCGQTLSRHLARADHLAATAHPLGVGGAAGNAPATPVAAVLSATPQQVLPNGVVVMHDVMDVVVPPSGRGERRAALVADTAASARRRMHFNGAEVRIGDVVMNTRNTADGLLVNGEIGVVVGMRVNTLDVSHLNPATEHGWAQLCVAFERAKASVAASLAGVVAQILHMGGVGGAVTDELKVRLATLKDEEAALQRQLDGQGDPREVVVHFRSVGEFGYPLTDLADGGQDVSGFMLAYMRTVHKAQGASVRFCLAVLNTFSKSEDGFDADAREALITTAHPVMNDNMFVSSNFLLTAATRAQHQTVLYHTTRTMFQCARPARRVTFLTQKINAALQQTGPPRKRRQEDVDGPCV